MTRVIQRSPAPSEPEGASASELAPGTRLGRYELLCPIAEGGMAQVWAAEQTGDLGFRKLVALKTIRPDYAHDASFRAMFLDEAQLASRIRHANVVEVLDLGVSGDIVFQAMALIEGASLSEWARSSRLPVGVATRIAIDILRGLHAAHDLCDDDGNKLGLVHRDVSPHNVLVGADGVAKLADFGIAKAFGRAAEETQFGDVKGKIGYVAPEQLQGYPAAPQSDLFSAGVVFWELLTGDRLFRVASGASPSAREGAKIRDPRAVARDVPASISAIAMRALRESPFDRYETSLEMADALEEAARAEGLAATHREVATQLDRDMGSFIAERREALRLAKKRGVFSATPNPVPSPALSLEPTVELTSPTVADVQATRVLPLAPPVPRVIEGTDSVAVAEPALLYAATEPPPRRGNAVTLALAIAGGVLIAVVLIAATRRDPPSPPPPAAAAVVPPAPVPVPAPTPAPVVIAEPTPTPIAAASSAPVVLHRPILPHGRTRPPATKPPTTSPGTTATPRFENPY